MDCFVSWRFLVNHFAFSDSSDVACFRTCWFILEYFGQILRNRFCFCCAQDNPEIDDMAHFAKADVTICTTGNFCGSVAMLNPKCVLVSKRHHPRIRGLNRILYDTRSGCVSEYVCLTNVLLIGRSFSRPFTEVVYRFYMLYHCFCFSKHFHLKKALP